MTDRENKDVQAFMRPFPEAEDVFASQVAAHRRVLLPLLSIDASAVDAAWSGRLHFVLPIEPDDALIGMQTVPFHSGYCQVNWIAFKVRDSKYEFAGDFRYFRINADEKALSAANRDYLEQLYAEKNTNYEETKALYRETGELRVPMNRKVAGEWFWVLGGDTEEGNWTGEGLRVEYDGEAVHPLTHDGRRFRFVGSLVGHDYLRHGPDFVLLFYDPVDSIVVMTFEWS